LEWGIGAFASMIIVVKMGDTGAYFFGKLFGRRKMAPVLSPNKTLEGAVGAICFSLLGAWAAAFSVVPLAPPSHAGHPTVISPFLGWSLYAVLVCAAGMFGDLAESLLKRDVGSKNSSTWMPGLGGILDLLDSILLAAPVAHLLWDMGVVGP
jgi:phosphatidate cytidylyltransferase